MKKSGKQHRKSRKPARKSATGAAVETTDPDRRATLLTLRNGLLGTAALGGAAWWSVGAVRATALEQDLSRIGQGKPAIVQIHDPQCPMCTQLQRATRKALTCFSEDELVYLVANIRGDEGRQFAQHHLVPHVTLMLFDAAGKVQDVLSGVREAEELKPVFQAHAGVMTG